MGFKGKFEMTSSSRLAGTRVWSFVLKCTNLFMSETVDCMICDEHHQHPFYFRQQTFKAGKSYRFDFDSVDWDWSQGDFFAILGSGDKIVKTWEFRRKIYGPGECPDCHGTHRCKKCHGEGFVYPHGEIWNFKTCPACGGTGECQTCDVPVREPRGGGGPTGLHPF